MIFFHSLNLQHTDLESNVNKNQSFGWDNYDLWAPISKRFHLQICVKNGNISRHRLLSPSARAYSFIRKLHFRVDLRVGKYNGINIPSKVCFKSQRWVIRNIKVKSTGTSEVRTFFYRQLHFPSQPESCLAILANGVETKITLPAKTCLIDSSPSEFSFGTKISMRNQVP